MLHAFQSAGPHGALTREVNRYPLARFVLMIPDMTPLKLHEYARLAHMCENTQIHQIWCRSSSWICTPSPHVWKHTDTPDMTPFKLMNMHAWPTRVKTHRCPVQSTGQFLSYKNRSPRLWVHYKEHSKKPFSLFPQGLALINGTQMITSLGCEAVERASAIARQADIVAALTLEVLKGTTKAFDTGQQALLLTHSTRVLSWHF